MTGDVAPEDVSIIEARPGDEQEVARFEAAFDQPVSPSETRHFLTDDRHHLVLGYLEGKPAGFASAVEVFHPDKEPELFLNEIGVMEWARRRGVGRALIEELKRIGRARSCVGMWVLTDEGNPPAMNLYRGTGGQWNGETQVMFEYELFDASP